jgi:hypothetical protein
VASSAYQSGAGVEVRVSMAQRAERMAAMGYSVGSISCRSIVGASRRLAPTF